MGDQVGVGVSGTLFFVPFKEFERVRSLPVGPVEKTSLFAALCRINTLYMVARAGSGHIGSSFSSMDIMSWLHLNELRTSEPDSHNPNDIFFSSKGHDAPALYNIWIGLGRLDFDLIHKLRRLDGLPGHPDVSIPNVVTNTGSLGMGISKAKGMIFANRLQKKTGDVFVLTGDGELQEGQFWESLISASNHKLHELTVVIDHNKLQSDTLVSKVSDLGDLEAKLAAFGWHVSRCDGNDVEAFSKTLASTRRITNKPKFIIADTIKGRGVSFMEHTSIDSDVELYKFHSGAPSQDAYVKACTELIDAANARLGVFQAAPLELETVERPRVPQSPGNPQRLIQAYSEALVSHARGNGRIVALDADLILDTGLISFKSEFPDRFVECGIAEQDMVSVAGGMALSGLLPVVHSFSCFLSSRPNEQIYNNATERTKVVYVGSLAGAVPAGPGHSHQAVRDISALAAIPGLVMMEPSCSQEVEALLDWALNVNETSSYVRLSSVPWEIPFSLPRSKPTLGQGIAVTKGADVAVISHGPVMLSVAVEAARALSFDGGIGVKVINLPWLNHIDAEWLLAELAGIEHVFSLEDHYQIGGQGDRLGSTLAVSSAGSHVFHHCGLDRVPSCGGNLEVLANLQLDVMSICDRIKRVLP